MAAQMSLLEGPITFAAGGRSTQYYGGEGSVANVNGTIYIALSSGAVGGFRGPPQDIPPEPLTYIGYSFNPSGAFSFNETNGIDAWFNSFSPQNAPAYLESALKPFGGSTSQSDFGEFFETLNNNGTATYYVAVVNASSSTPAIIQVDSITATPIAKAVDGDLTAHLGTIADDSPLNEEIFEVDGAPTSGQVQGTYIIFNSSGTVLVGPSIGFNFTDGKAHVSEAGAWNSNSFLQLVEVWNQSTGLADLQLSLINPTNGGVTTGWTAPTELQNITKLSSTFVSGSGAGFIVVADGTNAAGVSGAFLYDLNDTTASAGGPGGSIGESAVIPYSGTVLTDAQIVASGIADEFVVFWVDGNGMTIDLINSSLQVLETYNIATAGDGDVTALGDDELLVTYATNDSQNALILSTTPAPVTNMVTVNDTNGDYEIYDISNNIITNATAMGQVGLEWQVAGFGRFFGADTADMLLRNGNTGQLEVYDISNDTITSAAAMGQVGLEWEVAGFGDFGSNPGETDMLMRNTSNDQLEVYDISNDTITFAAPMGQVGLDWTFAGFGDFSGRSSNETDMLMRNSNNGDFEVYDISNNTITFAAPMGQVGLEWSIAGFGDFSGRAGETGDMLMRNINTGAFEVYDITNNTITSAAPMGQVGLEWQVAGFGDFSGNANETDMLMRNNNTGAFEIYDITNNTITLAAAMGQAGLEWRVAGFSVDPSTAPAANSQLAQALATFAPASGPAPLGTAINQQAQPSSVSGLLAAPTAIAS